MENEKTNLPDRVIKRRRRALWGASLGLIGMVALQLAAPATDHQFANIACYVVGLITILFVGWQCHRWAQLLGYGFRVPVTALMLIAAGVLLFQFDGFSGELVPQFKFRFGDRDHRLRKLADAPVETEPVLATDAEAPAVSAKAESTGFLGNHRNGSVTPRQFAIPTGPDDAEVIWNQGIGEGWSSFAVASGRAVTLEQRDNMDCVTCYDLLTGELLWMQSHPARHNNPMGGVGPRSTPTIADGRVYAQDAEGLAWCIDLVSGDAIWSLDLLELAGWTQSESEEAISWGRAGSPLLVNELCVLPFGGPALNASTGRSLIAVDAENGEVRWTAGEDQISYASPGLFTLAGQQQIVSVNEKTVTGHRIEDGSVLWNFEWPGQSNGGANCAMAIAAGTDRFLIGKGYGGGGALVHVTQNEEGVFSAQAEWASTRMLKTKFTHACVDGDTAYAISNGSLEAIAIADRQLLWTQPRRSRFGQGQILLVEDVIVGQAETGEVVFVRATPEEYEELSRIDALHSKTWNIPTVAGRFLLVRNDRQAICFRLPKREAR